MADPETLKVYSNKAEEYADLVGEAAGQDPHLIAFISLFAKGSTILDLGCGPGHAAHAMANAGLLVTATDAVPEMIGRAGTHPGVRARVATFDDISGENLFDGIWANFSLLHAPRSDMPRHLSALHAALKPEGILHIALKSGTGEKRDALGRLYTYYEDAELTAFLNAAGFTVKNRASGCEKGLDGVPANWIALRAYG